MAERRAALTGYVNSVFRVGDMLHGVLGDDPNVELEIYDLGEASNPGGTAPGSDDLLFDSDGSISEADGPPSSEGALTLDVGGRRWLLIMSGSPSRGLAGSPLAWTLGIGGLLLTTALYLIVSILSRSKREAGDAARRLEHTIDTSHTLPTQRATWPT